eukprot:scaffold27961_cov33-Phaeocystis_antarctica.AAC.1
MNVETCGHVSDLIVMAHAFAELRDGVVARQHEERSTSRLVGSPTKRRRLRSKEQLSRDCAGRFRWNLHGIPVNYGKHWLRWMKHAPRPIPQPGTGRPRRAPELVAAVTSTRRAPTTLWVVDQGRGLTSRRARSRRRSGRQRARLERPRRAQRPIPLLVCTDTRAGGGMGWCGGVSIVRVFQSRIPSCVQRCAATHIAA